MKVKYKSEFGKGLSYCLGLFLCHAERNCGEADGIMDRLWFNCAGDHIFELQIPDKLPKELKERLVSFKDFVLGLRMENATKENKDKAIEEAKDLLREIDSFYGIETEKGEWE